MPYRHAQVCDEYAQRNICDEMQLLIHDIHRMITVVRWLDVRCGQALFKLTQIVVIYSSGNRKLRYAACVQVVSEQCCYFIIIRVRIAGVE